MDIRISRQKFERKLLEGLENVCWYLEKKRTISCTPEDLKKLAEYGAKIKASCEELAREMAEA